LGESFKDDGLAPVFNFKLEVKPMHKPERTIRLLKKIPSVHIATEIQRNNIQYD